MAILNKSEQHIVDRITDTNLKHHPFVFMSGIGTGDAIDEYISSIDPENLPDFFDVDDLDYDSIAEEARNTFREQFTHAFVNAMPEWYDYSGDCNASCPYCAPWNCLSYDECCIEDGLTVEEMGVKWAEEVEPDIKRLYDEEAAARHDEDDNDEED